jgi:hypothetical protein
MSFVDVYLVAKLCVCPTAFPRSSQRSNLKPSTGGGFPASRGESDCPMPAVPPGREGPVLPTPDASEKGCPLDPAAPVGWQTNEPVRRRGRWIMARWKTLFRELVTPFPLHSAIMMTHGRQGGCRIREFHARSDGVWFDVSALGSVIGTEAIAETSSNH